MQPVGLEYASACIKYTRKVIPVAVLHPSSRYIPHSISKSIHTIGCIDPKKASVSLCDKSVDHEPIQLMIGSYYRGSCHVDYSLRLLTIYIISADSPRLYKRKESTTDSTNVLDANSFVSLASLSSEQIPPSSLVVSLIRISNHERYVANQGRDGRITACSLTWYLEQGTKLVDGCLWTANDTQARALIDRSSDLNSMSDEFAAGIAERIQPLDAGESNELLLNGGTMKLSGKIVAYWSPDGI